MRRLLIVLFIGMFAVVMSRQVLPAEALTIAVTNTSDCAVLNCGSLRDAINQANATPGQDTITITATGTLTLLSNLPTITDAAVITGPGQASFSIAATCAGCAGLTITGSVILTDVTISTAQTDGILVNAPGALTVRNVTISNAATSGGSGMRVNAGALAGLSNVTISGSQASSRGLTVFGTVTADGSTFSNNTGGGIVVRSGSLTLTNSNVVNNQAPIAGGIEITGGVTVISSTLIAGNNVSSLILGLAGGLRITAGSLSLSNSTVANNTASNTVGGVDIGGGTATLSNVTIAGNTAGVAFAGSGLQVSGGNATLQNTIVANNSSPNCGGTPTSLGNNLASDGTCSLNAAGDKPSTPAGFATGVLANNGGLTQTIALAGDSAAVDTGSNGAVSCAAGSTDQRGTGFPRVTDGDGNGIATCDIGAFELQPSADVAVTKTTGSTSVNAGASATFTITVRNNGPTTAGGIVATDTLPAGLTFSSLTPASGAGFTTSTPAVSAGGTVTINIATMAPNASLVFTLVTQVSAGTQTGSLTNTVSVTSTSPDPQPANNTATATVGALGATPTPSPTPTITPVVPTPFVPPVIPQVFQNPGAIAAVGARPVSTPTPRVALAPAAVAPAAALPVVISPPRTGDAGLRTDRE